MKIENIFVSIFLFALIIGVMTLFYAEITIKYDVEHDGSKLDRMTQSIAPVQTISSGMKDNIQGGTNSVDNAQNEMLTGGYSAIRNNPFTAATTIYNITNTVAIETGLIQPMFIDALNAIILILLIMAIIYLIFRYVPR